MDTPLRSPRSLLAILLLSSALPAALQAQTTTIWEDSSSDHLWSNPANWSNGLPGAGVATHFTGAGSEIILEANATNAFGSLDFIAANHSYLLRSATPGTVYSLVAPSGSGSFRGAYGVSNSSLTIQEINLTANAGSNFAYNGSDNQLIISGGGNTRLAIAYNAGFSIGSGNGNIASNSNNSVVVENGALLSAGLLGIGGKGAGNTVTVTGENSRLNAIGLGGNTNFHVTIGNATAAATNRLSILNGATATISHWDVNIIGGSLVVGKGSSITQQSATRTQSIHISSQSALYGAGTITTHRIAATATAPGGPGAQVYIGETTTDFGLLTANTDWINTNLTLNLQVGDLTPLSGAVAGENYDFLDLNGTFTYGGNLVIDLSNAAMTLGDELQLIDWTSATGDISDLQVSLLNGANYTYDVRSNGVFIQAIPEPGTIALAAFGILAILAGVRRSRK